MNGNHKKGLTLQVNYCIFLNSNVIFSLINLIVSNPADRLIRITASIPPGKIERICRIDSLTNRFIRFRTTAFLETERGTTTANRFVFSMRMAYRSWSPSTDTLLPDRNNREISYDGNLFSLGNICYKRPGLITA